MPINIELAIARLLKMGVEIRFTPTPYQTVLIEISKYWEGERRYFVMEISLDDYMRPQIWLSTIVEQGVNLADVLKQKKGLDI